jgi:septum formation topological specificity factor MinE
MNSNGNRINESMLKTMKQVRRDILKLIQTYIDRANDYTIFNQEMLPTL